MRKYSPLVALLLAVFLIGCGGQTALVTDPTDGPPEAVEQVDTPSPEVDPIAEPSPTGASESATDSPEAGLQPAICVEADAEFPVQQGLPPVSADDHVEGPSDAEITLIEYSDFQ